MATVENDLNRTAGLAWAAVFVLLAGLAALGLALIAESAALAVAGVALGAGGLVLARLGHLMTTPVETEPRDPPGGRAVTAEAPATAQARQPAWLRRCSVSVRPRVRFGA